MGEAGAAIDASPRNHSTHPARPAANSQPYSASAEADVDASKDQGVDTARLMSLLANVPDGLRSDDYKVLTADGDVSFALLERELPPASRIWAMAERNAQTALGVYALFQDGGTEYGAGFRFQFDAEGGLQRLTLVRPLQAGGTYTVGWVLREDQSLPASIATRLDTPHGAYTLRWTIGAKGVLSAVVEAVSDDADVQALAIRIVPQGGAGDPLRRMAITLQADVDGVKIDYEAQLERVTR